MSLREFHIQHTPAEVTVIAGLYTNVENGQYLHEQLLAGNSDFEYAFVDVSLIVSVTHALAAVFRAIRDMKAKKLKSRNVHSEIVYDLSPSNKIIDAFKRFGINEKTRHLLVVKVGDRDVVSLETVQQHLDKSIKATALALDDESISHLSDIAAIQKTYKLQSQGRDLELEILAILALKGA